MNDHTVTYPALVGTVTNAAIEYSGWGDTRKPKCWEVVVEDKASGLKSNLQLPLLYAPPAIGSQVVVTTQAESALGVPFAGALTAGDTDDKEV